MNRSFIGHTKQDHALGRNFLHGQIGVGEASPLENRVNALLVGCGFNLRKLCRFLAATALNPAQSTA